MRNPLRILLDKDDKINFPCFHFGIGEHLCFHNKNRNEREIGHRALPFSLGRVEEGDFFSLERWGRATVGLIREGAVRRKRARLKVTTAWDLIPHVEWYSHTWALATRTMWFPRCFCSWLVVLGREPYVCIFHFSFLWSSASKSTLHWELCNEMTHSLGKLTLVSERIFVLNIFTHSLSHSKLSARQSAFISSCDTRDQVQMPATFVVATGAETVAVKGCWE